MELAKRVRWVRKRIHDGVHFRLRSVAGGRFADRCQPTTIAFLITERCNARCLHCDIWMNRGQEDQPTVAQWTSALDDLRDWLGPVHVVLTGGEALLRSHTPGLVRHGSERGLFIELLTHGYWGDQSRVEAAARANPWRITLSLDGLGPTHDKVRGREGFFDRTSATIENLVRMREREGLDYSIRLKCVVMSHNLHDLPALARFATRDGMDILYQPIEQNYNREPDDRWFEHSDNWPSDPDEAAAAVERLREMKRDGYAIANTDRQLDVMVRYFRAPAPIQQDVRGHQAASKRHACGALGLFQVRSNGDVTVCPAVPPIGNIKRDRPRDIWAGRPRLWESGCCRESGSAPPSGG